ncbi:MAG: PHP domain-containing protein [Desulfobulbaceae bacterium]
MNRDCIDLHLHSHFSDGTASPEGLVRMAVSAGLRAVALTDHDTVEGVEEFLRAGSACSNLKTLAGLEISATHRDISLHILGYGIDHTHPSLLSWLARLQEGRGERNRKILARLRAMGHDLRDEDLADLSSRGQAGRPHIAALLVQRGIVRSLDEAFTLFLRRGGAAYQGRFTYSAAESIDMIHRAGGIAVLAHPGILAGSAGPLSLLVAELVERGMDGIEAYYPAHTPEMVRKLVSLGRKYQLVLTGGSDYHGNHRGFSSMAGAEPGFCPPTGLLEPLLDRMTRSLS